MFFHSTEREFQLSIYCIVLVIHMFSMSKFNQTISTLFVFQAFSYNFLFHFSSALLLSTSSADHYQPDNCDHDHIPQILFRLPSQK